MRFGFVHRVMTDALAVLGLLALVTSGHLERAASLTILVGLCLALVFPERWQSRGSLRYMNLLLPLGLLVMQAARLLAGGPVLTLAIEFAAGLQIVRLTTRRGAAHDQQVIVLALLHLIAATVLGGGLAYGLCFLGFLIIAPGALVLSHLRREVEGNYRQGARDRTGLPVDVPRILRSRRVIGRPFLVFTCLLSVPIFIFTAVLFVLFPRVGLSLLFLNRAHPERMVGFSDRVDLGGVGKLRTDPTIAMRVDYPVLTSMKNPPTRVALYLRGTAFDQYDGRRWSRSRVAKRLLQKQGPYTPLLRSPEPGSDRKLIVDLEPIDPPVLFLPEDTVALRLLSETRPITARDPKLYAAAEDQIRYDAPEQRGLRYEVFLSRAREPRRRGLRGQDRNRYLTLPPNLSPKIASLARQWVGASTEAARQAVLIEAKLRRNYTYDLESPSGTTTDPLEHFLFESKRGHCEYYSTAMAILLRTLGVPTRNVTGFIGGTYNRFGKYYAVRQGDAHSWTEVYIDGRGWQRFDPTPPANAAPQTEITGMLAFVRDLVEATSQRWSRHVVGYDLGQQVDLLRSVRRSYDQVRSSSSLLEVLLASPKRLMWALLGAVLVGLGAFGLLKHRSKHQRGSPQFSPRRADVLHIVRLYQALEGALSARGVPRPASQPPLMHAQALFSAGHPVGAEVLELTQIYLEVRFGEKALTQELSRDFEARAKALRSGLVQRRAA